MSAALEARLSRLEAIEDVKALKARYTEYVDGGFARGRFVREDLDEIFTDDAHWYVTGAGGEARGRDEIHNLFDQMRNAVTWSMHYVTNAHITVDAAGGEAAGTFYLLNLDTQPLEDDPGAAEASILTLKYEDRFVKEDGRWLISSLHGEAYNCSSWSQGWVREQWRPGTGPGSGNLGATMPPEGASQ